MFFEKGFICWVFCLLKDPEKKTLWVFLDPILFKTKLILEISVQACDRELLQICLNPNCWIRDWTSEPFCLQTLFLRWVGVRNFQNQCLHSLRGAMGRNWASVFYYPGPIFILQQFLHELMPNQKIILHNLKKVSCPRNLSTAFPLQKNHGPSLNTPFSLVLCSCWKSQKDGTL